MGKANSILTKSYGQYGALKHTHKHLRKYRYQCDSSTFHNTHLLTFTERVSQYFLSITKHFELLTARKQPKARCGRNKFAPLLDYFREK